MLVYYGQPLVGGSLLDTHIRISIFGNLEFEKILCFKEIELESWPKSEDW